MFGHVTNYLTVKLTSGALAIFSPVTLTTAVKAKVAHFGGRVGYIVALNIKHYMYIHQWVQEYPNAIIIGPEGLLEKLAKRASTIHNAESAIIFKKERKRDIRISEEFDHDIEYEYVDGHANKEVVFHYKPDKVLIEADLMFNLPAVEQYIKIPKRRRQGGAVNKLFQNVQSTAGDLTWMKRFNWYIAAKDRPSFNDSIKFIDNWEFTTLIPCHGEVIEDHAKKTFRKVFQRHLQGKKST